jgi:hypothetical protein
VAELGAGNVPELGPSVARGTQRDDVVERVGVPLGQGRRLHERTNRNDVVYVGVATQIVGVGSAADTRVVVPFECPFADVVPSGAVRSRRAAVVVGVSLARVRFREPIGTAVVTAEGHSVADVAEVAFDLGVTPQVGHSGIPAVALLFEYKLSSP